MMAKGENELVRSARERSDSAQRATWLSAGVNLGMTLLQLLVGWLAHSQSLFAHGLHSFSDLLSDLLVIFATRQSAHPADAAHPYGHARFETAATLVLGISLMGIGGGVLWDCVQRLQHAAPVVELAWSAFWVAVATVLAKEALYRYLVQVADRLRSQLLLANALHTRADAASALVVVVGIAGALAGWPLLDLLAAGLMGFMILRMGGELARDALRELIDTGLDEEAVQAIRATVLATPGVVGLHALRTRHMAQRVLVDAHVQVDARISVSEGHRIAELVHQRLLAQHAEVLDVLVHIDPEDDGIPLPGPQLPEREVLLRDLAPWLTGLSPIERVVLHYLGGQVEVEVYLPATAYPGEELRRHAQAQVAGAVQQLPALRRISLFYRDAL